MGTGNGDKKPLEEIGKFNVDALIQQVKKMGLGKLSGWRGLEGINFCPGELSVVAGRTAHCKTSFLLCLLLNWLENPEYKNEAFLFYSYEVPEPAILIKLTSALLGINGEGKGNFGEVRRWINEHKESADKPFHPFLVEQLEALGEYENRLYIYFCPKWSAGDLENHISNITKSGAKVGGVLVDYLQMIPVGKAGGFDRRDIEVSNISRGLKQTAVEFGIPVVAGAQINREAIPINYMSRLASARGYDAAKTIIKEARPALHHLREGGIEQEADLVLGLLSYRADYTEDSERRTVVPETTLLEVGTLKYRYGASGKWYQLAFQGKFGLVRDIGEKEQV